MICHVNSIRKKRRVSHKDCHFRIVKKSIQWKDIILKLYVTKSRDSNFVKQNIDRTKERDKSIIIVGNFNILFSVIVRQS